MKIFQVVAAKNNQKVNLSVRHESIEEARASLHSQGYSIIELKEILENVGIGQKQQSNTNLYYFSVANGAESKNGQIYAIDILRAYKKLYEGLGYEILSIYENPDSSDDEKTYVTAKAKEAYLEFKKYEKVEDAPKPIQQKEKISAGPLQREVERYQGLIDKICTKIENLITYTSFFTPERIINLKELLTALKQAKQTTNIDKLKLIGEAALLKIGQLEVEIQGEELQQKRNEFLKETNALLKGVGSKKRVNGDGENLKQKISLLFKEITQKKETTEIEAPKAEKGTFAYYKNLRELSVYEERLSILKKEIRSLFFKGGEKKKRLLLKKRLLEQNILITRSRVSGRTISYSRIVKGLKYYGDVVTFLLKVISQFTQYLVAGITLFLCIQAIFIPGLPEKIGIVTLFLTIVAVFGLLFRKINTLSQVIAPSICFLILMFALIVNF